MPRDLLAVAPPAREPRDLLSGLHRGNILPIDRDVEGGLHLNWQSGWPGMIGRALSTTGKVRRGEMSPMVPDTGQGVTAPEVEEAAGTLGMFGPMSAAAGSGRAVAGAAGYGVRRVPTREELRTAGSAGFEQARKMGVDYHPDAIASVASTARAELENAGFMSITAPKTFHILGMLESPPANSVVQLSGIIAARRALQKIPAGPDHNVDREAARRIIAVLDGFTKEPPAGAVLAGPAAEAGRVLEDARGNWAALERSKEVSGRARSAERRARASNSGANIDNTLRQRAASLLDQIDKGTVKGFSREEYAQIEAFSDGTKPRNLSRKVANALGGGGGIGTFITGVGGGGLAGAYGGKPIMGALIGSGLPTIGLTAKGIQNSLGRKAITKLDESIRMRSPLYGTQAMGPLPPMPPGLMSRTVQRMPLGLLQLRRNGGGGY